MKINKKERKRDRERGCMSFYTQKFICMSYVKINWSS